ncbi:YchJ family metal-binding protein [Melaminivora sp.]
MNPAGALAVAPQAACPCGDQQAGRPRRYADCCGRYLEAGTGQTAPDAERLMRSRYSAFVLQRGDYLLATWHASRRPARVEFEPGARWLGLQVRQQRQTGPDSAEVEFIARQRQPTGRAWRLHERSRFVREQGRWYYLDGDLL